MSRNHVYNTSKNSWSPMGKLFVYEFEEGYNTFIFSFQTLEDKSRVWNNCIWNMDDSLMVMDNYHLDHAYDDYNFSIVPFWIQFHGIPRNLTFSENMIKVANSMVKDIKLERMLENEIINWKFAHACIEIQVLKPFPAGKLLKKKHQNDPPIWIQLRYEIISKFCHIYGLIIHVTTQCHASDAAYIEMNDGHQFQLYGNWLKANLRLITLVADNIKMLPKRLISLCVSMLILEALII